MIRNLTLHVSLSKGNIFDYTSRVTSLTFGWSERGCASLRAEVRMTIQEAVNLLRDVKAEGKTPIDVQVREGSFVAWRGRAEDLVITETGIGITALGYWSATKDIPLTSLWSTQDHRGWQVVTESAVSDSDNQIYTFETQDRLFIGLKKDETYDSSSTGYLGWMVPHLSGNNIAEVEFDYDTTLDSDYKVALISYVGEDFENVWSSGTEEWSVTATGSGSVTQAITSGKQAIVFYLRRTGTSTTYTGETGDRYLEITNVRVKGQSGTITLNDIIDDCLTWITDLNEDHLSTSTIEIDTFSDDILEFMAEDETASRVIERLSERGTATQTEIEYGVDEHKQLYFRERGSNANTYGLEVERFTIRRSFADLVNSAYGKYRTASGRTMRTDVAGNTQSQKLFGVIKRKMVESRSTDLTTAEDMRDMVINAQKDADPLVEVEFGRVVKGDAVVAPWHLRPGDSLQLRHIPVEVLSAIGDVRTLTVAGWTYTDGRVEIQLEKPSDDLPFLLGTVITYASVPLTGRVVARTPAEVSG